jgi:hypothetical protein
MAYASSAVAAMEAHRAVGSVAQDGLLLLAYLAVTESNVVSGSVVETVAIW